jgi:hypothetical protein
LFILPPVLSFGGGSIANFCIINNLEKISSAKIMELAPPVFPIANCRLP